MRTILLLGAGRSASTLIQYLLREAEEKNWQIIVADRDLELVREKLRNSPFAEAVLFDVHNREQARREVERADVVISMLPAHLHMPIARLCVHYRRPLVTASYVSPEMQALDQEAKERGVLLLNEMGLDPGIDHLSAMKVLDELRAAGAEIELFKSYAGGLISPEADNNPWRYKFTWNPRNVVLAGQGTARYIEQGQRRFVPYHRIFQQPEPILFEELGAFEGYPNRNSLAYRSIYKLDDIPTLQRGTIRYAGFCQRWNTLVQLGLTEDHYVIEDSAELSYRDFLKGFLPAGYPSPEDAFCQVFDLPKGSPEWQAIEWLGLTDATHPVGLEAATPAQILQQLLEEKWKLAPEDKDMIVMQHKFGYQQEGKHFLRHDSLVVYGDDTEHTAMAKCVGLPLGIAVKLILEGCFEGTNGVLRPVLPAIYEPTLEALADFGITFTHRVEARDLQVV